MIIAIVIWVLVFKFVPWWLALGLLVLACVVD